jgi:hypothetical protein
MTGYFQILSSTSAIYNAAIQCHIFFINERVIEVLFLVLTHYEIATILKQSPDFEFEFTAYVIL